MARIQLESYFFSSPELLDLSHIWKRNITECMGALIVLWHYSQQKYVDKITKKQLEIVYAEYHGRTRNRLIDALIESGWLKNIDGNFYYIRGNQLRIEKVKTLKTQVKEAARARWGQPQTNVSPKFPQSFSQVSKSFSEVSKQNIEETSDDKSKKTTRSLFETHSELDAERIPIINNKQRTNKRMERVPLSSRARKASTDAPCQSSAIEASVVERKPNESFQLVEHWGREYERRWKAPAPKPTSKNFGQAKQILARCKDDLESAKNLVSHFFTRLETQYVNSGHTLDLLQRDFNKLWSEIHTGERITQFKAKQASIMENNLEVGKKFLENDFQNPFDALIESGQKQEAKRVTGNVEE